MSSSESSENNSEEQQVDENILWLKSFLKRTFFTACPIHWDLHKNDLNRYCISCDVSACRYCIALDNHGDHQLLKIYRHVYKDVVPLGDMEEQIDCSRIQPYRCNKKLVISLRPLPHNGSGVADKEGACDTCFRKLNDPIHYRFCSIACKYPWANPPEDEAPPEDAEDPEEAEDPEDAEDPEEPEEPEEVNDEPEAKRHRRKGYPYRAPFF